MNEKEKKTLRELDEKCKHYKEHFETQNQTIWTYQKFFMENQEALTPILNKWKKSLGKDPYIVEYDPVRAEWEQYVREVREEEKATCRERLDDLKFKYRNYKKP